MSNIRLGDGMRHAVCKQCGAKPKSRYLPQAQNSQQSALRCAILVGFAADSQINAAQWRPAPETRLVVSEVARAFMVSMKTYYL